MIWSNGFSARYEISIVDPASWRDISFLDMTGGSIDKTTDNLMESADIDMRKIPGDGEVWIRIWLDARQEGSEPMHVPLFTGLTTAPERSINGSRESYSVECFSVLKPASDILMQRGWYAPEGIDGAALASSLLKSGPAPVAYEENSPLLSQSIIAEDNETNLSMAEKIISAIGWRIRVSGDGRIGIMTKASEASAVFDATRNDSLQMQVTDTSDWYSCGIHIGAYIFSRAVTAAQASEEAERLYKAAKKYDPDLPLYIDLEASNLSGKANILATAFLTKMDSYGARGGIYANLNWFTHYISPSRFKDRPLWIAQYNRTLTAAHKSWYGMWQFSSSGKVSGISGKVDMNHLYIKYWKKKASTKKKSINAVAKEVIAGKWGNGSERKKKLKKAGYDYNAVQKKVNQILK